MAVFYAMLTAWFRRALNAKYLYSLPIVMLLWVNFHIGFVFGFVLLGGFLPFKALLSGERQRSVLTLWIAAASAVAGCVNPAGLNGLLYPLNIFRNYAYSIEENQPLFGSGSYMMQIHSGPLRSLPGCWCWLP